MRRVNRLFFVVRVGFLGCESTWNRSPWPSLLASPEKGNTIVEMIHLQVTPMSYTCQHDLISDKLSVVSACAIQFLRTDLLLGILKDTHSIRFFGATSRTYQMNRSTALEHRGNDA